MWLHDVVAQTTEVLITIAKGLNNINAVITYKEISDIIEKKFKFSHGSLPLMRRLGK